jgi:hypothetical protein
MNHHPIARTYLSADRLTTSLPSRSSYSKTPVNPVKKIRSTAYDLLDSEQGLAKRGRWSYDEGVPWV